MYIYWYGDILSIPSIRGYGATAARLTPDQKVGSSNLSALIFHRNDCPSNAMPLLIYAMCISAWRKIWNFSPRSCVVSFNNLLAKHSRYKKTTLGKHQSCLNIYCKWIYKMLKCICQVSESISFSTLQQIGFTYYAKFKWVISMYILLQYFLYYCTCMIFLHLVI